MSTVLLVLVEEQAGDPMSSRTTMTLSAGLSGVKTEARAFWSGVQAVEMSVSVEMDYYYHPSCPTLAWWVRAKMIIAAICIPRVRAYCILDV